VVAIAPPTKSRKRKPPPFEIVETLLDGYAELGGKPPSRIWPAWAYEKQDAQLRKDAARGLRKHVFRKFYESGPDLEDLAGKKVILFLSVHRYNDTKPVFVANGAWESFAKRAAVVKLIAANPREDDSTEPTEGAPH